jgi:hypothetical protein
MTRYENLQAASGSSPFLRAFLQTDKVRDDAAKRGWADGVERRLRVVSSQIDPRPIVLGYAMIIARRFLAMALLIFNIGAWIRFLPRLPIESST